MCREIECVDTESERERARDSERVCGEIDRVCVCVERKREYVY